MRSVTIPKQCGSEPSDEDEGSEGGRWHEMADGARQCGTVEGEMADGARGTRWQTVRDDTRWQRMGDGTDNSDLPSKLLSLVK
jgi:hypothetical protein